MESPILGCAADRRRLSEALRQAAQMLARAGVGNAALDAEVLLGHALGLGRAQLIVMADAPLGANQLSRFESLLARRREREPVAYIVGQQEFWSLDFHVTRDVLVPRPDTERLIEGALLLAAPARTERPLRVLDIGTGSGAIAVSLASELAAAEIVATDFSPAALAIAEKNAGRHGVAKRITFRCGDLFAALGQWAVPFDLIVANPPYIRRDAIASLEPEVSRWEPRAALDGGTDGLDFYRRIAAEAGRFLAPTGALALEIGADMGRQVRALFNQAGCYRGVTVYQDYAGRDRVVTARFADGKACSN